MIIYDTTDQSDRKYVGTIVTLDMEQSLYSSSIANNLPYYIPLSHTAISAFFSSLLSHPCPLCFTLIYSVLFSSPPLCPVLFCFILFCSVLFYSALFHSVLFCSVSVLFCSVSVLFCSVSVLFCSVLFCSALFCSVLTLEECKQTQQSRPCYTGVCPRREGDYLIIIDLR